MNITQIFTELAIVKECNFSNDSFFYPTRKNINKNLIITEEHLNITFGSFRKLIF